MQKQSVTQQQEQKTFTIGSEWLYYKIYCGVKTADDVLLQVIKPICDQLLKDENIDQWFFIRYNDPEPHLRVRFHTTGSNSISRIINLMHERTEYFIERRQIWDLQIATYERELTRYGATTIGIAETLFYYDSEQVSLIIQQSSTDEDRFLNAFHWVEELIHSFNFPDEELINFLERMQQQFKAEFNVVKQTNKQLNLKYKSLEPRLFESENLTIVHYHAIQSKISELLDYNKQQQLKVTLDSLLASFIHMTINRIFRSRQRLCEMMIYDFLTKKNTSKMARYGKL
jgi:thiopeptide-type bacteriocin biosynthesis protein